MRTVIERLSSSVFEKSNWHVRGTSMQFDRVPPNKPELGINAKGTSVAAYGWSPPKDN